MSARDPELKLPLQGLGLRDYRAMLGRQSESRQAVGKAIFSTQFPNCRINVPVEFSLLYTTRSSLDLAFKQYIQNRRIILSNVLRRL